MPFVANTWAFLPGGRHVFNGMSFEPDRAGYPLHVYDLADRRVTHSFGGPTLVPLPGHEMVEPMQQYELYDTVIEILDTRWGTVLGRTQVDVRVVRLVGQDGFYSYAEHSELGEAKYVVWSVGLSG